MKSKISAQYALQLSDKLSSLQTKVGDIPEAFLNSEKANDPVRAQKIGFDVNQFFGVFDKIKLKKGKVLDYAYYAGGIGGEPLIYSKDENEPGLSASEYLKLFDDIHAQPYLKDIVIKNDPGSFFQLVVFSQVVHQFYQYWHAAYNDHRFIFSLNSAEGILEAIPANKTGISREDRKKLRNLLFEPQVENMDDWGQVRCVMFSEWSGFYYNRSTISWPNISIEMKKETIVPYDCGICF